MDKEGGGSIGGGGMALSRRLLLPGAVLIILGTRSGGVVAGISRLWLFAGAVLSILPTRLALSLLVKVDVLLLSSLKVPGRSTPSRERRRARTAELERGRDSLLLMARTLDYAIMPTMNRKNGSELKSLVLNTVARQWWELRP